MLRGVGLRIACLVLSKNPLNILGLLTHKELADVDVLAVLAALVEPLFCFEERDSTLVIVVDDCFLFCYFTNLTHKYLEPNRLLRCFGYRHALRFYR